jgi:Na+/H+ antiporter NhaD/arsenite permease-like protein
MIMRRARRITLMMLMMASPGGVLFAEEMGKAPQAEMWMAVPFLLLLLSIALMPFINRHWWEKNYPSVSIGLGVVMIGYYVIGLGAPGRMLHSGQEYVSFIMLIGSLFVVAGGIHVKIKGKSRPVSNLTLLGIGAVLSNIVGTTGASMILIRPFLRVNRYRIKPYHVVFFIFTVSNMGGALTPIGDPPLFLGYLRGVPFFWVAEHLFFKWAIAMIAVLAVFYVLDRISFGKLPASIRHGAEGAEEESEVAGMHNIVFLVVILVAVFIQRPLFLREALMLLAAAGSYYTTKEVIHKKNEFNFLPVKEVAILFFGIFATMVPALDWLEQNAASIGLRHPGQYYWATGSLSAFLDNAPTYLNFLSAAIGLFVNQEIVQQVQAFIAHHGADIQNITGPNAVAIRNTLETLMKYHYDLVAAGYVPVDDINTAYLIGNHNIYLQAISIAAVFFGACTYIGNGPNFMVKAIAAHAGVETPNFIEYIVKYTLPVLLPIFLLVWLLFFNGTI